MNAFLSSFSLPFPRLALTGLLACAPALHAQNANLTVRPADRAAYAAERHALLEAALETAVAYCAADDLAAAETALLQANLRKPDTIQGELEIARRLMHLASILRGRYDYATSNRVLARALARLEAAKVSRSALTAAPHERARLHEIVGFIHEQILPDAAAARTAYALAQRETPESKAAAAGLARLQQQEEQRARFAGQKN